MTTVQLAPGGFAIDELRIVSAEPPSGAHSRFPVSGSAANAWYQQPEVENLEYFSPQ